MSVITDPVANTDGWWAGERRVFWCLEPFKELRNWAVGRRWLRRWDFGLAEKKGWHVPQGLWIRTFMMGSSHTVHMLTYVNKYVNVVSAVTFVARNMM